MKIRIPRQGEERTIKRFAILPIRGKDAIYWLEWVCLWQSYSRFDRKWNTYFIEGKGE